MLSGDETLENLRARFARTGTVRWLGVRPAPRAPLQALAQARLLAGHGMEGDHRARRGGRRQVTLIQHEHLQVVGELLGTGAVDPALVRRNVVVSGVNLQALKGMRFRLGTALLEATGPCHPCSRMEQLLGAGGYNAMRGHGGVTAVVVQHGQAALGDALEVLGPAA